MSMKNVALTACMSCMAGVWFAYAPIVQAQSNYPTHPLRIRIPFPAGSASDTIGCSLGSQLAVQIGQAVVVGKRPGAAARLATKMLVKRDGKRSATANGIGYANQG